MPQDLQILQDPVSGTGLGWDIENLVRETLDAQAIEALQDQGYTVVLGTENSDADRRCLARGEPRLPGGGANGSTIHPRTRGAQEATTPGATAIGHRI